MDTATKTAFIACAFFGVVGVLGWMTTGLQNSEVLPLLLYYSALVVNTFFSIQVFSAMTPRSIIQTAFDVVLVCIYVGLALSFGAPFTFALISASLFIVSIAKYTHLSHITSGSSKLLKRKRRINALGVGLSLLAAGLAWLGSPLLAAWFLGVVFLFANIYLLTFGNMYRSDY